MKLLIIFIVSFYLVACGGGGGEQPVSTTSDMSDLLAVESQLGTKGVGAVTQSNGPAQVSVTGLTKIAERRVSRTVFEYDFKVVVSNLGQSVSNVNLTLSTVGAGSSIVQGTLQAANLGSNTSITLSGLVTVRHDRLIPFETTQWQWNVSSGAAAYTPSVGIILTGAAGDQALTAIKDYRSESQILLGDIQAVPNTNVRLALTRIGFGFKPGTTVGQVNSLLQALNAGIDRSFFNTAMLYLAIPKPSSIASYLAVFQKIEAYPFVDAVTFATLLEPESLPVPYESFPLTAPTTTELLDFDHHIAARVLPAWNAVEGLSLGTASNAIALPHLVVSDKFGMGAPQVESHKALDFVNPNAFSLVDLSELSFADCITKKCYHGYHVLGIVGASNADNKLKLGSYRPTGVIPVMPGASARRYSTEIVNNLNAEFIGFADAGARVRALANQGKNVVLNTSYSESELKFYNVFDFILNGFTTQSFFRLSREIEWLKHACGGSGSTSDCTNYNNRVVHASAAANIANGVANPTAEYASGWNSAALNGKLTNTLVVENRRVGNSTSIGPYADCLSAGSFTGGNISAIGSRVTPAPIQGTLSGVDNSPQGVLSYGDNLGNLLQIQGTSMATPQVAGFAAYLWSFNGSLTATQIVDKIKSNAVPNICGGAPMIDVYTTLLSIDSSETIDKASVRVALLDIAGGSSAPDKKGDGKFDAADLRLWAFILVPTITVPPAARDYSRYDLNGDGFTGGSTNRAKFNLDMSYGANGVSTYSTLSRKIGSTDILFNETILTDLQILCYYAYSSTLYSPDQADLDERDVLIGQQCGAKPAATLTFPDPVAGWIGLPAVMKLSDLQLDSISNFQISANSPTCGSGERGAPLFSQNVDKKAVFYRALTSSGVPSPATAGAINRRNCSSFYATVSIPDPQNQSNPNKSRTWINATGRSESFTGGFTRDWEYQVRFDSGDPFTGLGRSCTVGIVANAGGWGSNGTSSACTFSVSIQ
jgi:Subtilase family